MSWRLKTWGAALVCLSFFLAARPAAAESCEQGLGQARENYENGELDGIPELLEPCRRAGARRADKIAAYILLAQAFSASDQGSPAREAVAQLLRLEPGYVAPENGSEPPRFVRLVQEERKRREKIRWALTASGFPEDLWEVPASVTIVTAGEIERRGSLDLEAVLHDLPGFDVTRGNGDLYASLYPRGVRSTVNDGILLLVDGIAQDDPLSSVTDLSRQYPLAGVEQVEVLQGPAADVYGPRAYAAVINVVTRNPGEHLAPGQTRVDLLAAAGSFGTYSVDLEASGRSRLLDMDWSLGGRSFRSDEADLSGFADWDYRYDDIDYRSGLRLTGEEASRFVSENPPSPLYEVRQDQDGKPVVELSDLGLELARANDRQLLADRSITFSDQTEDWLIHGKTRLSGLTLGFQHWLRQEGVAPWYGERFRAGSEQGGVLSPRQTTFFADYRRPMARARLRLLTQYQQSDFSTRDRTIPVTFASGRLGIEDLVSKCTAPSGEVKPDCIHLASLLKCAASLDVDPSDQECNAKAPSSSSTRLTSRWSLSYDLTEKLEASVHAEVGWTSLPLFVNNFFFEGAEHSIGGPLQVRRTDTALAAQVSYRLQKTLRLVAAGRLDRAALSGLQLPHVEVGPSFHPRVALIWSPRDPVVFKAVYSGGSKEPLNRERYSVPQGSRLLANPDLLPEKVQTFELIAGWRPAADLAVDATLFEARYRDLVEIRPIDPCISSSPANCQDRGLLDLYVNGGRGQTRGLQIQSSWQRGPLSWSGNYTFTDPNRSDPAGSGPDLRVADIARHRLNLGFDAEWTRHWITDLRLSYVGERRTGSGTTVPTNPLTRVDAYTTARATLSYRDLLPGTTLQLIVDNLLDEKYEHPGVREAGTRFVASIPQPGRGIFLRFLTRFPGQRSATDR